MTQAPPRATQKTHTFTEHGHTRIDHYHWMRLSDDQKGAEKADAQTAAVLDYINAENHYSQGHFKTLELLQDQLYTEMVARIKKDDSSVPYFKNAYWYYVRYEKGKEYPIYARKKESLSKPEEIILDVNILAKGQDYYAATGLSISPNNRYLAYGEDLSGRRIYSLKVIDLETQQHLPTAIPESAGDYAWANDNKTLFYTQKNPQTLLPETVKRHTLGSDVAEDITVYTEQDDTFYTSVYKSKSDKFIIISNHATLASDYHLIPADSPHETPKAFIPREKTHEYDIYHHHKHFYIRSNWQAQNFRLFKVSDSQTAKENWQEIQAHNPDIFLKSCDIFDEFLVLSQQANAQNEIKIIDLKNQQSHKIAFDEPVFEVYTAQNPAFKTDTLRLIFSSLKTPATTLEYDMRHKSRNILKQQEVLGGFNANDYDTKRIYATAADGAQIPISLLYKKGFKANAQQPLLLYGYGSYGITIHPSFSSHIFSLVDRGFVYAIAHVRGSQMKGRPWYEAGKMFQKKNTFTDFIAASEHLIQKGYSHPKQLYAMGGSAGGLLMGAIANMRPDLYHGLVSAVPFVDVISTMLDESIPLTTGEFDEWGNPKNKDSYEYMLAYSPYDQIKKQHYPNMLITSGYHDSQVQYWEPLKYAAKLRDHWQGNHKLYLHMEMAAGHGGKSGRFKRLEETAMKYAFLLDLAKDVSDKK